MFDKDLATTMKRNVHEDTRLQYTFSVNGRHHYYRSIDFFDR